LQFGPTNTIWQKRSSLALRFFSYDLAGQSSTLLTTYDGFPSALGPVAMDFSRNLLVGINIAGAAKTYPDTLALYEISDLDAPMLIAAYDFPANAMPNPNLIGQAIFAGNRVYAVDGNNGIVAFEIVPPLPPSPQLNIAASGAAVLITWPASATGATLQASPVVSPPVWTNVGAGTVVGAEFQVIEPASAASMFYRLVK
jgi:hypothetical protein